MFSLEMSNVEIVVANIVERFFVYLVLYWPYNTYTY